MGIEVKPVANNKKEVKKFLQMAAPIYKDYPHWVAPIYSEVTKFIVEGPFNKIGEKQLFMAYRDGKPVARVSAHMSYAHNDHYKTKQGFFGFFEAYDDEEATKALFAEADKWLKERGCTDMLGPMNFAIYDEIGLLVDNFDDDPVVMCLYNPPYYLPLLEKVGFVKEIDWYSYYKGDEDPIPPVMSKLSQRMMRSGNVTIRNASKKNWQKEVTTVRHIFEHAWSQNWGNVPFSDEQWEFLVHELKMVVKEELAFILELDGEPIGFSVTIPDANFAIKKAKGRLFPFGIFKILWNLRKVKRVRTVILGILEEYRQRGYHLPLIQKTIENGTAMGYKNSDCSLIVENNAPLITGLEKIGAYKYKTYRIMKRQLG